MRFTLTGLAIVLLPLKTALAGGGVTVAITKIDDMKAVIATVEPVRELVARARIAGTIVSLKVKEGDRVTAGAEVAAVADQKIALQIEAIQSRIRSAEAQQKQSKIDFNRVQELQRRGVSSQAQLDQARTALDVAERNLAAIKSDRDVIVQQAAEGAVLAPGAGRVLKVPVSDGRVVMAGETIATLAEDNYILRLSLPERHAQSLRAGEKVEIGSRGAEETAVEKRIQGTVRLVYPEIRGGRVIADVDVQGLGDYFVGERTRVYVSTGKRDAILVPKDYVASRAGLTYARLEGGALVPIQTGETRPDGIEVLSGLKPGDIVVKP